MTRLQLILTQLRQRALHFLLVVLAFLTVGLVVGFIKLALLSLMAVIFYFVYRSIK